MSPGCLSVGLGVLAGCGCIGLGTGAGATGGAGGAGFGCVLFAGIGGLEPPPNSFFQKLIMFSFFVLCCGCWLRDDA